MNIDSPPLSRRLHVRAVCMAVGSVLGDDGRNRRAGLKEVPKDKTPPVYMQADEVLRFLSSVHDLDERRILTAYIYSGRRRAELLRLRWEDVSLERGEYFVRKSKAHLANS